MGKLSSKAIASFAAVSVTVILALVGSGLATTISQAYADSLYSIPSFEDCIEDPNHCAYLIDTHKPLRPSELPQ
jgi:hypothetical protein